MRIDVGLRRRPVAGCPRHALRDDLGRRLRAALLAPQRCSFRIHDLFGHFAPGEVDIQIDLRGHIARTDDRRHKGNDPVTVDFLEPDAVLKLRIGHHAGAVLRWTRQQIAILVHHRDTVLRHERYRGRYQMDDGIDLLTRQGAPVLHLHEHRCGRGGGRPCEDRLLGYRQVNPRRHKPVNFTDRPGQFNFLALLESHIFNRTARSHGNIRKRVVPVWDRRGQTLGRQCHPGAVIILHRDDHVPCRRV